jgi:hypothetical protein
MNELRLASRRLARAPGFFASAVVTLAPGMGANAFVYGAVDGLLVRPIPAPKTEMSSALDAARSAISVRPARIQTGVSRQQPSRPIRRRPAS